MRLAMLAIGFIGVLVLSSKLWASSGAPELTRVQWISAAEIDRLLSGSDGR